MGEPNPFLADAAEDNPPQQVFEIIGTDGRLYEVESDTRDRAEHLAARMKWAKESGRFGIRRILHGGVVVQQVYWISQMQAAAALQWRDVEPAVILPGMSREEEERECNRAAYETIEHGRRLNEARWQEEERLGHLEAQTPKPPHVRPLPAWLYDQHPSAPVEPVSCTRCSAKTPAWMTCCPKCLDRERLEKNVALESTEPDDLA